MGIQHATTGRTRFTCAVVGLGAIGSGAAYWLARRLGGDVVAFEQFPLGHQRGSSQDHSRVIRHSYFSPLYTRMTRQMFDVLHEVEAESGKRLVLHTGGLEFFETAVDDSVRQLELNATSMDAAGHPYERLDAAEIMRRFPQWRLPEDTQGLFQPEGGLIDIGLSCATHIALAEAHGAEIRAGTEVTRLEPGADGVRIHTDQGHVDADHVIVACNRWTNRVLAGIWQVPMELRRAQVAYVRMPDLERYRPERFPVWVRPGNPCFYGFPAYGLPAIKVSEDHGGAPIGLSDEVNTYDPDQSRDVIDYLRTHLADPIGEPLLYRSCVYDLLPDYHFVIDRVPTAPRVLVGLGAAHVAKFGSLVGRTLGELALDGATSVPVDGFEIDRPALVAGTAAA